MEYKHAVEQVAERYRLEGYQVIVYPKPEQVPSFVAEQGVDIIAYKGNEKVIVQVTVSREDLRHNPKMMQVAQMVNNQPGWRFDLVVLNHQVSEDKFPQDAFEPLVEQISQSLNDAEQMVL